MSLCPFKSLNILSSLLVTSQDSHGTICYDSNQIYSWYLSFFQKLVETQLQSNIMKFQCDGGDEFFSNHFLTHLTNHGNPQLIYFPHTPQQNGHFKRKHRHLIELGSL